MFGLSFKPPRLIYHPLGIVYDEARAVGFTLVEPRCLAGRSVRLLCVGALETRNPCE